jgi:hypothetical protein
MSWSNIKIKQLSQFIDLVSEVDVEGLMENLNFRAKVVSLFREIPFNQVRKSDVEDVIRISNYYLETLLTYKVQEPSGVVSINGVTYKFNKDRSKWTTGQVIDAKMLTAEQIKENPEKLLAIFYLNGDYDGDNKERELLFSEHFPAVEFWNFINFFLLNYEERKLAILSLMTARAMAIARKQNSETRRMTGSFGRRFWLGCRNFGKYLWTRLRKSRI